MYHDFDNRPPLPTPNLFPIPQDAILGTYNGRPCIVLDEDEGVIHIEGEGRLEIVEIDGVKWGRETTTPNRAPMPRVLIFLLGLLAGVFITALIVYLWL